MEHGVNVEGMKGPQLKAEVEKLVDLHAKVLPVGSKALREAASPATIAAEAAEVTDTGTHPATTTPSKKRSSREESSVSSSLSQKVTPVGKRESRDQRSERKSIDYGLKHVHFEFDASEFMGMYSIEGDGAWSQRWRETACVAIKSILLDRTFRIGDFLPRVRKRRSIVSLSTTFLKSPSADGVSL